MGDDVAELGRFVKEAGHFLVGEEFGLDDQAEPEAGFAELFEGDTQLVNEISSAFGGTTFLVIWTGGRGGADKLPRDVSSQSRVGESVNYFAGSNGKTQ